MNAPIFLQCDLSNAENRVELMLTGAPEMIALARTPPDQLNLHGQNAVWMRLADQPVGKDDPRYHLAKTTNHAAMRGCGPETMSNTLLKEGVVKSTEECAQLLAAYLYRYAPLEDYFKWVRIHVAEFRCLVNTWGRHADYRWQRLDNQLFQDAYSFLPQSEVADLMNEWGVKPAAAWCDATHRAVLHGQVHDSLLFSVYPECAWELATFLRASLERPRPYRGAWCTIPVEFALGTTWKMDREWKRLPPREEFVLP